jgi:protein regulator of cytokinesis 1
LEVARLEDLKASKMKELVLKKRTDMEELCRKAHIIPDSYAELDNSIKSMESGENGILRLLLYEISLYFRL